MRARCFSTVISCILGKNGAEKILELDAEAKTDLQKSVAMTKDAIQKINKTGKAELSRTSGFIQHETGN